MKTRPISNKFLVDYEDPILKNVQFCSVLKKGTTDLSDPTLDWEHYLGHPAVE